jgi:hypothetical protein
MARQANCFAPLRESPFIIESISRKPYEWVIEGFRGESPTGFSRRETGSENRVKLLLERFAARHLTDDEITEATLGSRKYCEIHRNKRLGNTVILTTTGTDYYYVAKELPN